MADELAELRQTIHVNVEPLPAANWQQLFYSAGFSQVGTATGRFNQIKQRLVDVLISVERIHYNNHHG
ncbi:hypothetical protein [Paenibacillus sp. FSL L8-0463]|uniref:hypothetical protein n=1 Tax=Paenibacillus sp. FSL L8-0463 TaxID=2954687 RepID=UPI003119CC35